MNVSLSFSNNGNTMEVFRGIDSVLFLTKPNDGKYPEIGVELDWEDIVFLERFMNKIVSERIEEQYGEEK